MEGNQTLSEIIANLCRTSFDLIGNITSLVVAEIQQAKWNLVNSALLLLIIAMLMSFIWLGICAAMCIILTMEGLGLLSAILCVTIFNVILMTISIFILLRANKKAFFAVSAKQFGLASRYVKDARNG
jgi:uncharacterized membrane protein YqjE